MIRRVATVVGALLVFGLVSFSMLSWRSTIAPIERPNPASFTAESVARGEVLAAEGHCLACHIRPGGQPFAGGYGVNTPFGVIYGDNITPDPKTGIGRWSLEAFTRAVREGVSRDGSHLFAAFPFNAYTELRDDDVKALYAYLMTRPAVSCDGAHEHGSVSPQCPLSPGRMEAAVFQERTLQAGSCERLPMESRRLSGSGGQRLWGLSYSAQRHRR